MTLARFLLGEKSLLLETLLHSLAGIHDWSNLDVADAQQRLEELLELLR